MTICRLILIFQILALRFLTSAQGGESTTQAKTDNVKDNDSAHGDIFFTSGQGASHIIVKLVYDDQSVERRDLEVPDWFRELKPDDAHRSYLALNLGKWDKSNKMIEDNHHFIFRLDVTPSPEKTLNKVYIHKSVPGIMVFYGATGVPTH